MRGIAEADGAAAHPADLSEREAAAAIVRGVVAREGRLDVLAAGGVAGPADLAGDAVTLENWDGVPRAPDERAPARPGCRALPWRAPARTASS